MRRSRFLSGALGALVMQGLVAACSPSESTPGGLEDDASASGDGDQQTASDDAPAAIKAPALGVQEASALVQKDGGQVVTQSGAVSIPKGAIGDDVTVKISQVDESKVTAKQPAMLKSVSPATAFEPHKQAFQKSVALTVFYESSSDDDLMVLRIDDEKDTSWERVEAKFDKGAASVVTTHFSIYTVSQCDPANDPEGFCAALVSGAADINGLDPNLYKDFVPPMNFGDGKAEPDTTTGNPNPGMEDAGVSTTTSGKDGGTGTTRPPPGATLDAGVLPDPSKGDGGTGGHSYPDGGTTTQPTADAGSGGGGLDASVPTDPNQWDGGKDTQAPDGGWIPPWYGNDGGSTGTYDGGGATCMPTQTCHPELRCPADIPSGDAGAGTGTGGSMDGGAAPSVCLPEELVEVQVCVWGGCGAQEDPCKINPALCGPQLPAGCVASESCEQVWECPPPPPSDAGAACPMVEYCDTPPPCDGGACPAPKCTLVPSCDPPPACLPEEMILIERCTSGRTCDDPCLSIPVAPECAGGPNPCDPAKVQTCQAIQAQCQATPDTPQCLDCHDVFMNCLK